LCVCVCVCVCVLDVIHQYLAAAENEPHRVSENVPKLAVVDTHAVVDLVEVAQQSRASLLVGARAHILSSDEQEHGGNDK
jgi:hypothetical protein